jgi:hypothetical protein
VEQQWVVEVVLVALLTMLHSHLLQLDIPAQLVVEVLLIMVVLPLTQVVQTVATHNLLL